MTYLLTQKLSIYNFKYSLTKVYKVGCRGVTQLGGLVQV